MREYLYILIIAAAVTYLLTPLVRRFAIAINAQHAPRSRDVHTAPTPLLGGLAMYGGLVAALLVADRLTYLQQAFPSSRTVIGLLLAAGLLVIIGIVDDRWEIGALPKLAGQIAAGGIVAWSGAIIGWIPLPGGRVTLSLEPDLSYTVTILIVVATINAVNFIDGLDGLAAGVVAISALAFMVYSYTLTNSVGIPSQSVPAVVSAVLAGICIGFLPHNFNPARIFMGDTGAMLLGLLLAYGPISSTATLDQNILVNYASNKPVNRFATILPLLLPVAILIIPYTDLLLAVVRRMARGAVAVRRRPPAPAPPAAEHGPLAPADGAAHVPVGGPVLRRGGRPLGDQGPADLAGPRHRRRGDRAGAGDHAEAPPVAVDRQARRRDEEPSPDRSHPGPFDRANDRRQRPGRSGPGTGTQRDGADSLGPAGRTARSRRAVSTRRRLPPHRSAAPNVTPQRRAEHHTQRHTERPSDRRAAAEPPRP